MSFSLDSSLGFLTNRLANLLKADLERGFAARGLNITAEQWLILGRLYEEDGLVQNELAKRTSKDKTNIARILALMETRQLIERRADPNDQRMNKTYLTPLGRSLQSPLVEAAQETLARAQKGLSESDVRQLIEKLNIVFINLS